MYSCTNPFKDIDWSETQEPMGVERVRANIEEGRLGSGELFKRGGTGGNFDFASSNELWRASLDTLDFLRFDKCKIIQVVY